MASLSDRTIFAIVFLLGITVSILLYSYRSESQTIPHATTFDHLPNSVVPSLYQITLEPHFQDFTFTGEETITIDILHDDQTKIVLHSHQLQVTHAKFEYWKSSDHDRSMSIEPRHISYNTTQKQLHLEFSGFLPKGPAKLHLTFQGILNDQLAGFYRSEYKLPGDSQSKWIATTQMQPNDARRVFPCWDEPSIKAKFEISLRIPKELIALSNMPEEQTRDISPTKKEIKFQQTPLMSTYLVAFSVGEFEFIETHTKEGVRVRVYTLPGNKHKGEFALDVAAKTLSFFTDYFHIVYPLPKLDMIAIPDFSAGAMENWGLVTYREVYLLINSHDSGILTKQQVAYVVAHELAHQWFGNLVTPSWWKELWLNEGFATWVGNLAVDHLFPQWNIWTQFGADYFSRAQKLDAMKSSHPIEVDINTSDEVFQIFDLISYSKGASMIRMLQTYLGETRFQKGLELYLSRHLYSNAVSEDLWRALEITSGENISQFMENWTHTEGYPVVRISIVDWSKGLIRVEQSRFFASSDLSSSNENQPIWNIPLTFTSSKKSLVVLLDKQEMEITLPRDLLASEWIYANSNQAGFYRVLYPESWQSTLQTHLHKLRPNERMGLQNDLFALSFANLLKISQAIELAQSYEFETTYAVWTDLASNLQRLAIMWSEQQSYPRFEQICRKLYSRVLERL